MRGIRPSLDFAALSIRTTYRSDPKALPNADEEIAMATTDTSGRAPIRTPTTISTPNCQVQGKPLARSSE